MTATYIEYREVIEEKSEGRPFSLQQMRVSPEKQFEAYDVAPGYPG